MHERQQFGKTLAQFQSLQFKIADMVTELVAARQMIHLAAFKLDSNDPNATTYCAMAKRLATDMCFNICNEALQILGGYGCTQDFPVERLMRDARIHQVVEGTNEIMKLVISRKTGGRSYAPDQIKLNFIFTSFSLKNMDLILTEIKIKSGLLHLIQKRPLILFHFR